MSRTPEKGCYAPDDSLMGESVVIPNENDILFGRGGKNNKHIGNEKLRQMARDKIPIYKVSSKKEKSQISRSIVSAIRNLSPPGRFLKRDLNTGLWLEVGDDVAREKTSQALRDAVSAYNAARNNEASKKKEQRGDEVNEELRNHEQRGDDTSEHSMKNEQRGYQIHEGSRNSEQYRHSTLEKPRKNEQYESQMYGSPRKIEEYGDEMIHTIHSSEINSDFIPPPPPVSMMASPHPSSERSFPAVVSPPRASPENRKSIEKKFGANTYNANRVSPTADIFGEFIGQIGSDMSEFDLFNGALLKHTDSGSSGSLSFQQPREKKMRY